MENVTNIRVKRTEVAGSAKGEFAPAYYCNTCQTNKRIVMEVIRTHEEFIAMLECGHYLRQEFFDAPVIPTPEETLAELLKKARISRDIPVESEVVESEDSSLLTTEVTEPEVAIEPTKKYLCPICDEHVDILNSNEGLTSKKYNLKCGHYATVYFGSNKILDTPSHENSSPTKLPLATPKYIPPVPLSETIVTDDRWENFLPYQRDGIKFGADAGFKFLLGDEMGLGKTIQAIGLLRYFPEQTLPALVICPGAVTIKWQREFKKWFNDKFSSLEYAPFIHQESIGGLIDGQKLFIMSAGILSKPGMLKAIKAYGFKTLIIDESHQYKNENSKRTKALFEVASVIPQTILMSGTSVLNRVMEYYNTLHLLRPRRWFSKKQLASMCTTDMKGKPLALSNYSRETFFNETKSYILRRTKDEVLKDLPSKFITEEWVDFSNAKNLVQAYNNKLEQLEDFMDKMASDGLSTSSSNTLFGIIAELRHLVGTAKALRAIDYVSDLVTETSEKICVGVHHRMGMGILADSLHYKKCPSCKKVVFACKDNEEETSKDLTECTGCGADISNVERRKPLLISSESPETKQERLDKFREDPDQHILILSILGGGVGMDIQFCQNVLVIERSWNRALEDQFENRFHRIGMTSQVTIAYMKAIDTIDEFFDKLITLKAQVSGSSLDEDFETSPEAMFKLAQMVVQKRLKFVGA